MKSYNYVYITTNLVNGKQYVGSHGSNVLNDRYLGSGILLYHAIKKYGKDNFEKTVLETHTDLKKARFREEFFISKYNTITPNGYNINPTAGSCLGCKRSDETKKRISSSKKGHIVSDETKHKISKTMKIKQNGVSNSFFGKHHTDVTKKKISESNKGKQCGENNPMKNSINVEKMKEAMMSVSYKWSGDNNPAKRPDVRNKIRIAAIGRKRVMNDDGTWHWSRGD